MRNQDVNRILARNGEELCDRCLNKDCHLVLREDRRGRAFYKPSICALEKYPYRYRERNDTTRAYYQCDCFAFDGREDVIDLRGEE